MQRAFPQRTFTYSIGLWESQSLGKSCSLTRFNLFVMGGHIPYTLTPSLKGQTKHIQVFIWCRSKTPVAIVTKLSGKLVKWKVVTHFPENSDEIPESNG